MKLNKFFLAGTVLAASLSLGSCVGDLDLTPTDPNQLTPDKFKENPDAYLDKAIGGVYLQYATYGANGNASVSGFDGGMSTFQRAVWILEECNSDEASWIPNDADYGQFQYGIIPSSNTVIMGTYSRLYINIAMCNQFIQTVNEGWFNLTTDALQAKANEYIRQARILRAGAYWYAIDNFGNVPYADESIAMGQVAPQLSTNFNEGRRLVYNRVVEDLEEVVNWYKQNDPNNIPAYGYVGLDAAQALLVKFYLNAEVYTGTPAWDKCYTNAQEIIARRGNGGFQNSGLTPNYFQNFGANNKDYVIGGAGNGNEILWTIPQSQTVTNASGLGLLSYANSTFMCNGWIGDAPGDATYFCKQSDYNSGNGWKCIVARPEFVEKFDWNDAAMSESDDVRVRYWKTSADGFNVENVSLTQADWGNNGYLAVKYMNWAQNDLGEDQANSPEATDQLPGDYAMIRLAEIYLSAAEAALNGGGAHADAVTYVNYIRERAGLQPLSDVNLVQLRDERCRELYTECIRRSDLIRYGQWISGYTWSWKNHERNGADFASNFNVYPLPSTTCARNGYTQNPNY
ncbi:MAG: RagB/SusD family nutrient uptake outer membrane protein [Muribaculaceae bacterium]|nr:RagB/SusD family nutrient uptake outer membrane protein [Muribaculaceae bacterium]MDE6753713.1 RagB/SusD family nutrient uptake outer membrane protein [Muribaculaceae bacterium]